MLISLTASERGAVVRGVKTAHLYPVSRDPAAEPPFTVGDRHALFRRLLDHDEQDEDGKYVNRELDGTPKADPPECHVVITSIDEVPLADLVRADVRDLDFERITDVHRWWLDERCPSWRSAYDVGEHIGAHDVQAEFRRRLAGKTAWLVRWQVDRILRAGYLPASVGPPTFRTGPHLRSAGPVVPPETVAVYTQQRRTVDDNRRRQDLTVRAKKARTLMEQVDELFKGEQVPSREKRRHRARHRRTMHFLEQDVRGIEEQAKA